MGKGVLLEAEGRQGIVLTPEGEFKRVRLLEAAAVGEEVTYAELSSGRGRWWWYVAAAAVFLVALLPLSLRRAAVGPVVALVAVDINPSAEFDIDAAGRVAAGRGRNDQGRELLEAAGGVRGRPIEDVVAQVTELAVQRGYLQVQDAEAAVVVTVAPAAAAPGLAPSAEQALEERLQSAARTVVEEKHGGQAQVHAVGATAEDRAAAERLGVPLGKYLAYEALRSLEPGLRLTPEQIRDLKLGQVRHLIREGGTERILERLHDQQEQKGKGPGRGGRPEEGPGKGKGGRRGEGPAPATAGGPGQGQGVLRTLGEWLQVIPGRDGEPRERAGQVEQERVREQEKGADREADRNRDRDREQDRDKKDREQDGNKDREQERGTDRDQDRGKEMGKGSGAAKGRGTETEKGPDRGTDQGKGPAADRSKEGGGDRQKEGEREQERAREQEKDAERERAKDTDRHPGRGETKGSGGRSDEKKDGHRP